MQQGIELQDIGKYVDKFKHEKRAKHFLVPNWGRGGYGTGQE